MPGTGYTLTASDPTDGLTAVQSAAFTVTPGVPAELVFKQQPGGGTGGTLWSTGDQPTVWIEDSQGNLVTTDQNAVTLSIGTNPSNGTLSGCSTVNAVNGIATFSGCTIDKAGTGYTLTATDAADSLNIPVVSSAFNITVGPPSQLDFTTTPAGAVTGDPFGTQPTVSVEDAGGNLVTTATSTVSLAIGVNPSNGTLSGCSGSTTAGVATFSGCAINQTGTGYTLVATDGALASDTSNPFNVSPPQLTSFRVTPSTGTPTAGSAFSVTVTALDQAGGTFAGLSGAQSVAFSGPANAPNSTAPTYPGSVTFTNGVGTASVTLFDAQTTTLTATQGSITGTSGNLTVSPAAAANFSPANPGTQSAGTAFNVTISAHDTYGNNATGYTGTKTLSFSGPANSPNSTAPTYPSSVSFTAGVGTASITLKDAQTTTLTATQGTLTGTSPSFTVNPGSAASFTVPTPGNQTAGTAFNVTITAFDSYGNTATGYTGAQVLAFSGPANAPNSTAPTYPGSVSFAAGVGTASITLVDAQSTTLTATQGSVSGTSGSFTVVNAGGATAFSVPTPSTQSAGTAFNETITALDTYGNTATSYAGSKSLSFSGPSNAPNATAPTYPGSVTFTAGVGTASITLFDAQSTTLTVTQGSISGTSGSFSVSAGTAANFSPANPAPRRREWPSTRPSRPTTPTATTPPATPAPRR